MNIAKMMQQANKMQSDVKALQERLNQTEIDHSQSGVAVKLIVGSKQLKSLSIDASLIDPSDKETLEDVILAAINQAQTKAEEMSASETQKIMGGLQLPAGMKLPF